MTIPLTPEVMAAMERLRDAKDGNPPWEYADEDGIEARSSDAEMIADAMLSLFPPGMPAPVEIEMVYDVSSGELWQSTSPQAAVACEPDSLVAYRGLFIPLEVLETTK